MPVTNPPTITPAPSPAPQRNDRTTFSNRVDAFVTWLINAVAQFSAVAQNVADNANDAAASATAAASARADAEAAEDAAAAIAGATKWVSGSYAEGAAVWSPTDGQTYRRKAPGGASPTDPAADPTNWYLLGSPTTLTDKTLVRPVTTSPRYTRDDDGTISGGTWAIDYNNGPVIKATAGAAITSITMANWPASGTEGHLRLRLVNFGAYTITFPAAWKWVKSDLTTTTTFADLGLTLPSAGTAIVDLCSDDGGATIMATVLRG